MKLIVDVLVAGIRLDSHHFNLYAGRGRTQTIQLDVSNIVQHAIANAIGLPDSTNHPKKDPKRHEHPTSHSPRR